MGSVERTTRVRRVVPAERSRVYALLLDPTALPRWKVPGGMTLMVHTFDAREGGELRVSLTYEDPGRAGKTSMHTDTYRGRFLKLVPNELIVEEDVFESDELSFAGTMRSTIRLRDVAGGTEIDATHEGVPEGVSLADNELGWSMALEKLATLVSEG